MKKIRILIADDHKLVREAWATFLNNDIRLEVIASTGNSAEAVELAGMHLPDIVLMDIQIAPLSGMEATRNIVKISPCSGIIGISVYRQPGYARKMLSEGAKGYVTKNSSKEEMLEAIIQVHNGNKYLCSEIKNIETDNVLNDEPDIDLLTGREIKIIQLVKEGSSSKKIAEILNISPKTVEVHRYNILKKLKLKNSSSLVHFINSRMIYS